MRILLSLSKRVAPFMFAMCATASAFAQDQSQGVTACAALEHRQFDFWLGDWDVFEGDASTKAAQVRVERTLDGCVINEYYDDRKGLRGQSVSIYDRVRGVWHQTWVTNRGQLLWIEGQMHGDEMILSGSYPGKDGEKTLVRGTWRRDGADVREKAITSTDGGKTWTTWFDLVFRRPNAGGQANEDARIVASLDTQYQAAVKHNDVTTMDRILADDFILVTGSGKVVTKSDLIEEARAALTIYERQEDSEQMVRVWGNTAIVTAKLWAKGTTNEKPFETILWFSDTYVRMPGGWRYVFGQASLPLTKRP